MKLLFLLSTALTSLYILSLPALVVDGFQLSIKKICLSHLLSFKAQFSELSFSCHEEEFETECLGVSDCGHQPHLSLKEPASPDWPSDVLPSGVCCPCAFSSWKDLISNSKFLFLPLVNADLKFIGLYGDILYVLISEMHSQGDKIKLSPPKKLIKFEARHHHQQYHHHLPHPTCLLPPFMK